jgi:glyoxylase-like metal-dependent hydrolase (beta-lactamase superfamily II)
MRLGDVSLRLVSDGKYWSDGAGLFGIMPKMDWQRIAEPDERNRVALEQRCLLIETGAGRILVDTGTGDKLSEKERGFISLARDRRLLSNLAALGVGPQAVDLVINTHLHSDHCGGNTRDNGSGVPVATFPRATYCVQRLELAEAAFPNERTRAVYRREDWEPLKRSGQLRLLDGDTRLTKEVRVILTPGHTPGHQCVVVEGGRRMAVFLGDVATWPIHIERLACVAAFDVQPLVSMETKRRLARWAVENEVLLIFEHHPQIMAGYLRPADGPDRFRLDPVPLD